MAVQPGCAALHSILHEKRLRQRDVAYLKLCWGDQALLNQTNALLKPDMNFVAHLNHDCALSLPDSLQHAYLLIHMLTWQSIEESSI